MLPSHQPKTGGVGTTRVTAGNCVHYERHQPEEAVLCQLVQEIAETFFAQVETETGSGLPDFVKDEFAAHPHRISPILQVISRAISTFLAK